MSTDKLAELYRAEAQGLRMLAWRLVRSVPHAEDLVHNAFANLLAVSSNEQALNRPYLRAAVRNLALNHLRDSLRRGEIPLPDALVNPGAELVSQEPSPEMVVLYRQELMRLVRAILALPPRRREAFVLARIRGLSLAQVGAQMGVSRNTAISHVVAACADLERQLA